MDLDGAKAKVAALRSASGIENEEILEHLVQQKVTPEAVDALSAMPLVEVVWADGRVDDKERKVVRTIATERKIHMTIAARRLLKAWLEQRPGKILLLAWKHYVEDKILMPKSPDAREKYRRELHRDLDRAAKASGTVLHKKSREERAVIDKFVVKVEEIIAKLDDGNPNAVRTSVATETQTLGETTQTDSRSGSTNAVVRRKSRDDIWAEELDRILIEAMSDKLRLAEAEKKRAKAKAALRSASGIENEEILEYLVQQEVKPEALDALSAVPLVAVVWADVHVNPEEREVVLDWVADHQDIGEEAHKLLNERWLKDQPSEKLLRAWEHYVEEKILKRKTPEARKTYRRELHEDLNRAAKSSGHVLSRKEKAVIDKLVAKVDEIIAKLD